VRFELVKACKFGHIWAVCGSDPALGAWEPSKAVPMAWGDGDRWSAIVRLPANQLFEFKFVQQDAKTHRALGWANDGSWGRHMHNELCAHRHTARANTAVGVSPKTFLLLLLQKMQPDCAAERMPGES
jgi:hypothetical protein